MSARRPSREPLQARRMSGNGANSSEPASPPKPSTSSASSKASPKAPARRDIRRETISKKEKARLMSRKLSFMEVTLGQVEDAMKSVGLPGYDLHMPFWTVILSGRPPVSFRSMENRTLTFWVKAFNKWVELRRNEKDIYVNGFQLQEMILISKEHLRQIAHLFDPEGGRRLAEGMNNSNMNHLRISVPELLMAGVLMSRLITSRHKLSFLFGLADDNDTGCLNKRQFALFVRTFICALGAAFAVKEDDRPTKGEIDRMVEGLYARLSKGACRRIQKMIEVGDDQTKQAVLHAIKLKAATKLDCPSRTMGSVIETFKSAVKTTEQTLPYEVLRSWCYGQDSDKDPLALPYKLTIERFCPNRICELVDEYDDNLREFKLSHFEPVPVPQDTTVVQGGELLTRAEVMLARMQYELCKENKYWTVEVKELDRNAKEWGISVTKRFQACLCCAIEAVHNVTRGDESSHVPGELIDIFRKLCPEADPKHLRMFNSWCEDYDELLAAKTQLESIAQAERTFQRNSQKPVIPLCELNVLEAEFKKMDHSGRGYIDVEDIARVWGWTDQMARETMEAFDCIGDGYLDKGEFFKMMCPENYRLPEMAGDFREILGKLLTSEANIKRSSFAADSSRFEQIDAMANNRRPSSRGTAVPKPAKPAPSSIFPEAEEELCRQWTNLFDTLDIDNSGCINVQELRNSGLVSRDVCESIAAVVDPEDKNGFTRAAFMQAIARAHERRMPVASLPP